MSNQHQITLFETTGFPNPARIRAALAEKNALHLVNFIEVDVMGLEHRTPAFYAMNPLGTVPVLMTHDGDFLSESTAITEYIDAYFEGISLTGTSAKDRGLIHMMQRRAETMVMDAVATYFHHATEGLGKKIERYQCSDWGIHQKRVASSGLKYFDNHLKDRQYVAADQFSMADITLFYALAFADFANVEIPDDLENLKAWRESMAKRPCFEG